MYLWQIKGTKEGDEKMFLTFLPLSFFNAGFQVPKGSIEVVGELIVFIG